MLQIVRMEHLCLVLPVGYDIYSRMLSFSNCRGIFDFFLSN